MIFYAHGFFNQATTWWILSSGYFRVMMSPYYSITLMRCAVHFIEKQSKMVQYYNKCVNPSSTKVVKPWLFTLFYGT